MFRKKHIISIHSIGSDDNENGEVSPEIISEEVNWANDYCESFIDRLKLDRFFKSK